MIVHFMIEFMAIKTFKNKLRSLCDIGLAEAALVAVCEKRINCESRNFTRILNLLNLNLTSICENVPLI